ncbi:PspC domain-containing protein [Kitasatospora sp. NPDC054939]
MTEDHRVEEAGPAAPPEPERPPLTRTERHRVVAGVCGGLGRHLDIDPVVFRVVTAVLCLSGGLGLFLYGLAWLIVPTDPAAEGRGAGGRTELQRVLTGRVDGQSVGAVLLTVIGTGVFFSSMGNGGQLFPVLLLGALVFHAVRHDPERRRRRIHGRQWRRRGGPYDRWFPEPEQGPYPPPDAPGGHPADWAGGEAERERHARERAAGTVPADTPHAGPTGYLWDPRHPERNPYAPAGGATPPPGSPGSAAQPWWQRSDLPEGDPLRKSEPAGPRRAPAPVRVHRHRHSFLGVLGLALAVGAACLVWSLSSRQPTEPVVTTVLATALLGVGLTVLVGARFGRARGLTVVALLLTVSLVVVGNSPGSVQNAFGERSWTVTSAQSLEGKYTLGLGEGTLDLTGLDPAGGTLHSEAEVGVGELNVLLPSDVTVELTVRNLLGDVKVEGQDANSGHVSRTFRLDPLNGQASKGTLDLRLTVGLGEIKVVQQ